MFKYKLYHDLPWEDEADTFSRKGTVDRAKAINENFPVKDLKGLDIGCAEGGISFTLQMLGADMTGVDHDGRAIGTALTLEKKYNTGAKFQYMDVVSSEFDELLNQEFDFAVWLANFMWICYYSGEEKAYEVMGKISESIPVLIFETAQTQHDGVAGPHQPFNTVNDVENFLSKYFRDVKNIGIPVKGWRNRSVFVASNK